MQDTYQCEVVTFTADHLEARGEELWSLPRQGPGKFGIKPENIFIDDLREGFVRDRLPHVPHKHHLRRREYLLGTSAIPRTSDRQTPHRNRAPPGADAISHGATGKATTRFASSWAPTR